jgi:sulfofructose kinase
VTLSRLGVETSFVGVVGDDETGVAVREGLAAEGVDVSELEVIAGASSPRSAILVDLGTGGRTIVHYPGTTPLLVLGPRAVELCRSAAWVHVDHVGYAAVPRDVRLSIDGGNPIDDLDLAGVALYAPTEAELRAAFGDADEALAAGAELVVVTRGERGSMAFTREGEVLEAPGFHVDAVSTLGAGDVFHGALLASFVHRASLADALRAANLAAALSCRALDGRSAIPLARELVRSVTWPT